TGSGEAGREDAVTELGVETVVPEDRLDDVVAALRDAHPYEEPAYDVYPLADAGNRRCPRTPARGGTGPRRGSRTSSRPTTGPSSTHAGRRSESRRTMSPSTGRSSRGWREQQRRGARGSGACGVPGPP